MINLGDKAKDIITSFQGIITAKCVYLNGCVQYRIQPAELKDGKIVDGVWIDEEQIVLIDKEVIRMRSVKNENGGPDKNPPKGRF